MSEGDTLGTALLSVLDAVCCLQTFAAGRSALVSLLPKCMEDMEQLDDDMVLLLLLSAGQMFMQWSK